jgi:hypothetical protein
MKTTVRKTKDSLGTPKTPRVRRRLSFSSPQSPITPRTTLQQLMDDYPSPDAQSALPSLSQLNNDYPSPAPPTPQRSTIVLDYMDAKKLNEPRKKRTKCGNRHLNVKPLMHFMRKMNECTDKYGMSAYYEKPRCSKGVKKQGHCRLIYRSGNSIKTRKAR